MATGPQKIVPHLWFDRQAEEAAQLYTSTFKDSRTGSVTRYTSAGFETHHMPEGMAMTVDFEVDGYRFIALNGGPLFKFNPSISFMVPFETVEEVDAACCCSAVAALLISPPVPVIRLMRLHLTSV